MKNGKNYIAVSLYNERDIASAVASKNNGIVQEISLPLLTFSDKSQANQAKTDYETLSSLLETLLENSLLYDNNKTTAQAIESVINEYQSFVLSASLPLILSPTLPTGLSVGARIKYLSCELLFSASKYFAQ